MKKVMYQIIILSFTLVACSKDKINLKITDFSKKRTVTLEPYNFKPYAMFKIKVKGFTNDTIRLNYNLYGDTNFFISGELDTVLVQTDYYGEGPIILIFDPYKADKGTLEIKAEL